MNILLIIPAKYKGKGWGGVMTYSLLLAKNINRSHRITILTPGDSDNTYTYGNARVHTIQHEHIAFPFSTFLTRYVPIFTDRVRWMIAVYAFVHSHSEFDIIESSEWGNSTLFLSLMKKRFVTVRPRKSQLQYYLENKLPVSFDIRLVNILETASIALADSVSSPTSYMLRTHPLILRILAFRKILVSVIPNAVDLHTPVWKNPYTFPYILSVGRLEYGKGAHILIRAFARIAHKHPRLRLVFVGRDMPSLKNSRLVSYKSQLRKYLKRHRLASRVVFVPQQTQKQLEKYYRHCSVYCLPSRGYENHPFVLLDAVKWKKAIVATKTGGIPEIVQNGKNGLLVPEDDIEGFATSLDTLLTNSKLQKHMEQYNKSYRSTFDVKSASRTLISFYKKTMKDR